MPAQEYTTISVSPEFRDELRSKKRGQESYEETLKRLLQN